MILGINIEVWSLVASLLTLSIVTLQLYLIYKAFLADHERRKKQATIEYINLIRDRYRTIDFDLRGKYGEGELDTNKLTDDELQAALELLSVVEHLAVGVNTGVYSLNVLSRLSGGYFSQLFERYYPVIRARRQMRGMKPTLFNEMEKMYQDLSAIRGVQVREDGNIKLS